MRYQTIRWLYENIGCTLSAACRLYMRAEMDHRPDHVVKFELLKQIVWDGYAPIMAFDNRDQVVKMWRGIGIPCAQVAEGSF